MPRLLLLTAVCAVTVALIVALSAGDGEPDRGSDPTGSNTPERASEVVPDAPAPRTAGRLAQVPDSPATRTRLAYADPERADPDVIRALGSDPVLYDGKQRELPETSAIAPQAQSAAQSCLGETSAQVILGPRTMGRDAALGVGIGDDGTQPVLRICGAAYYLRDIHATEKRLKRRFGDIAGAEVGENEIGEREIVFATVPVEAIERSDLLALMSAGDELRALGWR